MKRTRFPTWIQALPAAVLMVSAGSVSAQDWQFRTQNTLGLFSESERDLGVGGEPDVQELTLSIRPSLRYRGERTEAYVEARGFMSSNVVPIDEDEGGGATDQFAELRQFWIKRNDLFGASGVSFTFGRVRHRDDHRRWLDRDIESAALEVDRSRLNASLAVGKRLRSFRSDETDFRGADEDILHSFGHIELEWLLDQRFGLRVLQADDGSDPLQADDDLDIDGRWTGAYVSGAFKNDTRYFAEATRLTGEKTLALPSGVTDVPIRAWSRTASVDTLVSAGGTRLGVSFSTTSAGGADTNRHTFYQTGLHSNRMRLDADGVQFHQLNEAFRANTTNLEILGLFGHLPVGDRHSLSFRLQSFKRRDTREPVDASGVRGSLLDGEDDVGIGLDLAYQWMLPIETRLIRRPVVAVRASVFEPGDAFADESETKSRFVLEFKSTL